MINGHYTMTLYTIINNFYTRSEVEGWFKDYQLTDYLTTEQIASITEHGVWSKDELAKKIVDHFLMQEIGFETMALFIHYAKTHMQEIMEKYLPLIYSSSIEYDPLVNVDYTETFTREIGRTGSDSRTNTETNNLTDTKTESSRRDNDITESGTTSGTSTSNSTNTGSGLNIGSDTPMTNITKANILAGNYASSTSATENTNTINDSTTSSTTTSATSNQDDVTATSGTYNKTGTVQNNESGTNSEDVDESYTKNVRGNSGVSATAQKMVEQYRKNIIAIDKEIIDSCESLFMTIF